MKKFLIFCLVLLSINSVFAESKKIIRQNPYINNPYYRNRNYYDLEILPKDLSALEKYSMNRTYSRENPIIRLERLENLAFGAIQTGNLKSRYRNVENAILSRPNYNIKRNIAGNIANYFAGQATGITPSIYSNYDNINNPLYPSIRNEYGTSIINGYSGGVLGNRGFNILNNSFGNGSTIRILD